MVEAILRTRLVVPPLRPEWLERPHLLGRLDEVRQPGRRLALLSAPAGYGKTALAGAWARAIEEEGWAVAWISLSERERDFARFVQYLSAALSACGIDPGIDLLSPLGALRPPAVDQLLTPLLNQVNAALEGALGDGCTARGLALILDDYHLAATQRIHEAVGFMLEALPPRMRMVLATRVDPPLPLARMRARGELVELRAVDLRFSGEETAELLERVGLGDLPSDAQAALEARTEGWAAGLQLAVLSLQGRDDPVALIGDLAATHRYILDFLLEEILEQQPAHIQQFLLLTSVLDQLSAPLCSELLDLLDAVPAPTAAAEYGTAGGPAAAAASLPGVLPSGGPVSPPVTPATALLAYLESSNLFLMPVDDRRAWYRYHQLFRDVLENRLTQRAPALVPEVHRRASAWYEREGLVSEAVEHALAAQDLDRVARLLADHGEALLMRSETGALLGWLAALPETAFRERPLLDIWYAAAGLFGGQPADDVHHHLARAISGEPSAYVSGASAVLWSILALLRGDAPRATTEARRGLTLLPAGPSLMRLLATSNLGLAEMVTGDLTAAVRTYDRLLAEVGPDTPVATIISPMSNLAGLAMVRGELHRAAALYGRVLEVGRDRHGRLLSAAGKALMGLGEVEREQDRLQAAAAHLEEGIALTRRLIEMGAVVGYVSLMMTRQAQGDLAGAELAIRSAREVAQRSHVTDLDDRFVDCFEAWLWVLQGDLPAVRRWVEGAAPQLTHAGAGGWQTAEFHELAQLTLARARIALSEPELALSLLMPLETQVVQRLRMRRAMEIWVLQALALQQQGQRDAALAVLSRALAFGEAEGFVRVFADEGLPMARLLYAAIDREIAPAYAGRLLARFPEPGAAPRRPSASAAESLIEPLSERELEVLVLIAQGMTNDEIARELVIALSTVKGHTTNIYGKLGVRTRIQAVARARDLGLLPST